MEHVVFERKVDLINFVGSGKGCREMAKEFKKENLKPVTFLNAKQKFWWNLNWTLEVLNGF